MLEHLRSSRIQEMIAARVMGAIVPLAVVGSITATVAAALQPDQWTRLLPDMLATAFLLLVWGLVWWRKFRPAAHLFTIGLCVFVVVGMALNGGVLAPAYLVSLITITIAVLLYGPVYALMFCIAFIITGGAFVYLDGAGLLRAVEAAPPWLLWLFISIDGIMILSITAIPNHMLHQALAESEKKHGEVEEAYQRENKVLQSLRQNQEALEQLNVRYEALFEQAGDGILLLDDKGAIISVNQTFARMHGYTVEEIMELGLQGLDVDGEASVKKRLQQVLAGEKPTFEVMHYHKDGHRIPFSVTTGLVDAGGEQVLVVSYHDLTETKKREAYAGLLVTMLDEAPASITVHDEDGHFLYANSMTLALHGYDTMDEFMALTLYELDVPASQELIQERMDEIALHKEARFEAEHFRKDGSTLPLIVHAKRIAWQGRPALLSIASDISERRRDQEALAAESEFNQLIVQNAGQGISVSQKCAEFPYIQFTVWNDSMVQITGYTLEEINRLGWYQSVYPDPEVRDRAVARMQRILEGDDIKAEEWEITRKDGEKRHLLMNTCLNTDNKGEKYVLGVMSDVTEHKRAEEEVKRAYDFLNNIINTIGDPVFVKDEEHRFVLINDAEVALVGYSREDLIGKTDKDFFPEDQVKVFWDMDQQVLTSGEDNINEESITDMRTGETRIIVTRKTRYIDAVGKPYIVGISRDITEHKQWEEALRISEERFRVAVKCVSDFIYERDMNTGEAEFFGDIEGCLGYAPGTFPCSLNGWLECIHPDDFAQVLENLQQAPEHGGRYTLGYRIRRGDGTYANWEETGIILQDSNGTPTKCVGSANDVTARKQAEAERAKIEGQLRQAQKMEAVGLLAGGVAHEFNNLLQVILGLVEMVQMDVGVDSSNGRLLEDVNRAGKRAAELTQELLAFSRRQTLMPVNVDLNALVDAEINMLRPIIGANIDVHFIPGASVNTIRADKRQIEVVLMNLCINARDAMPHGGMLTIETDVADLDDAFCSKHEGVVSGTYARLNVTDTGHGMDEAKRAQIFDPFYTTKQVGEGSGLGLATVYGIVAQHKGAIDVVSEVEKGTTFSVYLPIAEGPVEEERPRVRRLGPGGTETILVAEDDEMLLSLLEKILTKSGYTVLLARNGEEALGLFEEHAEAIDMALLDVIMPVLGGQHVMEKIQASTPDMKFLFSSGYSENAIQTDFIIKDGLRLIKKPYKSSELLQAVRDTLDALNNNA